MQQVRVHDRRKPAFEPIDPFTPRSSQRQRTLPDVKDVDEIELPPQRPSSFHHLTPSTVPQVLPGPNYYSPAQYNQPLPIFPYARSANEFNQLYGYSPFHPSQYRHSPPESTPFQSVSPLPHVWRSVPAQRPDFQSSLNRIPECNTPPEKHTHVADPASNNSDTSSYLSSPASPDNKPPQRLDRFLFTDLIRNIYLLLLLNIPRLYFSRVERILKEAHLTIEEMKEMSLISSPAYINALQEDIMETGSYNPNAKYLSPAYERLITAWELLINSLLHDWNILNIMTVLLLTAIMSIFQINGAATDPFTRYTGFWSLICALMSLMYSCVFLTQFASMRQPYKAVEWAVEAQKAQAIFWNVWVMLATPVVWMSWSIIAFILSIMSFMWRVNATSSAHSASIAPETELILRVLLTFLLFIGLIYGILIITTLRRYGSQMDNAWERRINEFISQILPTYGSERQPPAPTTSLHRRSRSSQAYNHLFHAPHISSTPPDVTGVRSSGLPEPAPTGFQPPKWPIIPSTPLGPLGPLAEEIFPNNSPRYAEAPSATFESSDKLGLSGPAVSDVQQSNVLQVRSASDEHHAPILENIDTSTISKDEMRSPSHVYETGREESADSGGAGTSNNGHQVILPLLFSSTPASGNINLPRIGIFNDETGNPNHFHEADGEVGGDMSNDSVQTDYSRGILGKGGTQSHSRGAVAKVGEVEIDHSIHTDEPSDTVETTNHSYSRAGAELGGKLTDNYVETCSGSELGSWDITETRMEQPSDSEGFVESPIILRVPTPSDASADDEYAEITILTQPYVDSDPPSPRFIQDSPDSDYTPVSQLNSRRQTHGENGRGTNQSPALDFVNLAPPVATPIELPLTPPPSTARESPPISTSALPPEIESHIPTPSSSATSPYGESRRSSTPTWLANGLSRSFLEILLND